MQWSVSIEESRYVLRPDPLPPGVLDVGFAGRALNPAVPSPPWWPQAVRPVQVHGRRVLRATDAGHRPRCDGLRAARGGPLLTVRVADCLPVLLCSPGEGVALLHAGWRGMAEGILEEGLATFEHRSDLHALLGPAIGGCCFEVGEEVAESFPEARLWLPGAERPHVDLSAEAVLRLSRGGLATENIRGPGPCTRCHQHVLYSTGGAGAIRDEWWPM